MADNDKPQDDATKATEESAAIPVETDLIWVKSTRKDDRVSFYELDERHPDGNAMVATDKPMLVYKTPGIERALQEKKIAQTEAPEAPAMKRHSVLLADGRRIEVDVPEPGAQIPVAPAVASVAPSSKAKVK